jgi:hypothetical protein
MVLSDFLPPASDTWGPAKVDAQYTYVPIEFVGRTEKIGRVCDFTIGAQRGTRPASFSKSPSGEDVWTESGSKILQHLMDSI